jgi:RNA polymerase sigma-70 factor (ECF subfamily)
VLALLAMDAYRRYAPALVRKAQRILQNRDDAVDVVHNLFLDLVQDAEKPMDLPYLYKSITNRCLSLLRDRSTRSRILENEVRELRGPVRLTCDDQIITLELLTKLLDELDDAHAQTLVFRYFDEMSLEEIADVMQVSRKTVGNRLARVRESLLALHGPDSAGAP